MQHENCSSKDDFTPWDMAPIVPWSQQQTLTRQKKPQCLSHRHLEDASKLINLVSGINHLEWFGLWNGSNNLCPETRCPKSIVPSTRCWWALQQQIQRRPVRSADGSHKEPKTWQVKEWYGVWHFLFYYIYDSMTMIIMIVVITSTMLLSSLSTLLLLFLWPLFWA